MPSLSSFISSNQYTREVLSVPFVAAMRTGTGYRAPTFSGSAGTSIDPGGLFGWLIYARTNFNPVKGSTSNQYLVYTNPSDLIQDLNRLDGVTACLLAPSLAGGTFSFFYTTSSTTVLPTTIGTQFLHAINHLAYGGTLVLAGQVAGFNQYLADNTSTSFDIVIDPQIDPTVINWLTTQQYTTGIFPSIADATGVTGSGYTMPNYGAVIGSLAAGMTEGIKYFTVCGLKTVSQLNVSLLQANSTVTYTIPVVSDVGGFFARAKNRNELYLTVAGLDRATVINGDINNPIDWYSSLKTYLRTNKVNFFINYTPKFLGSDLVGATAATAAITVNDRIGPARLKAAITQAVNNIAFKYIFDINNQTTRNQVVSEVQTALDPFAPYLDTTQTQIICDSSNNQDNSDSLNIAIIAKPILGTDSFVINVTYTQ